MEIFKIKSKFMRGIMDQNTYVVVDSGNSIIIDAGADINDVKAAVKDNKVLAVMLTHAHFDHFWCIEDYIEAFDCDVYICEGVEEKFVDSYKNGSTIIRKEIVRNVPKDKIKYYKPQIKLENFDVEVLFSPGHCKDSVCLKFEKTLFSGDTLFSNGIGRTDIFDSDNNDMIKSLKKIKDLDIDVVYPGHYEACSKSQADHVISYFLKNVL